MAIARISFATKVDPFHDTLRRRVRDYLAAPGRSRFGGPSMWRKSLMHVALVVVLGAAIYWGRLDGVVFVLTFAAWQFTQFLMTIGVAHDATHGAYSRSHRFNRALIAIFDLLGIDSKLWIETHIDAHHATPNVPLRDSAIESFSLVRLHPRTERTWLSPHQHRYMFFVYSLVTLFQVYLLEPVAFAHGAVGFERKPGWTAALARMLAKKAFVLGYSLILPLAVLHQPWQLIALGWVLGHVICGLAIAVIFQTTHLHEATTFVEPDDNGILPGSFALHILKTTAEFSTENPLVTWIAGGLNLHVTHHLFPSVSQVHLPALSRIVRQTAHEYGMPYTEYSFFGAIRSHLRTLKHLGALPSMASPSSLQSRPQHPPRLGLVEILRDPKRFTRTRTDLLLDAALRHGPVVRLPKPLDRMYLVSDPDAVRRVLVDNVANWPKSEEYRPLAEWVGRGLITSEGEVWAADRRMLQPAFRRELLERLSSRIRESAESRVTAWSRHRALPIDITTEMTLLSIVAIGHRLFGADIGRRATREISGLMRECQDYVSNRMLSFDLGRRRFQRNMGRLRALIEQLSASAEPESIAALLEARGVDRVSRMDQILGFLVAGHETTAVALTWASMLLAKHPTIQARARREGGVFLRAVVEESMRLYPPVPCFARRANADDILAGKLVPRGAKVILAPHVTHRLPRYWQEPGLFDPDRFMPERRSTIPANAYFPFGMGTRTCIGAGMAMMECGVILETILARFDLEPAWGAHEPRAIAKLSLHPDRPVMLRMVVRASSSELPAPSLRRSSAHRRAAPALARSSSRRPSEWTA